MLSQEQLQTIRITRIAAISTTRNAQIVTRIALEILNCFLFFSGNFQTPKENDCDASYVHHRLCDLFEQIVWAWLVQRLCEFVKLLLCKQQCELFV